MKSDAPDSESQAARDSHVNREQLRQDVEFLAGRFPHRSANTDSERTAAEYVRDRFVRYSSDVFIDDFFSINSHAYLFASYYGEFVVVALLATWVGWIGLAYGTVVFLLYMAEFTGYSVLRRLLPHYETQNVVARFLSTEPKRLLIVTANYDSPKSSVLATPPVAKRLRLFHLGLVLCMLIVLISCAADGLQIMGSGSVRYEVWLRWAAVAVLVAAALILFLGEGRGEGMRGANTNASGTALLLSLAQTLHDRPMSTTDIWLVATGSKETWMSGMQHLVHGADFDREQTYFLNVTSVGGGTLHYIEGEGMLHVFPASRDWMLLAREEGMKHGVTGKRHYGFPTDAIIPLTRGYKTLSVMATDEDGVPTHWRSETDTVANMDFDVLDSAAEFVESLVYRLDQSKFDK